MAGPVDPRLLRRARATRTFLVAGVGVGSLTALCVVAQAWLLAQLVARVFDSGSAARLPLGGLAPALAALAGVIGVRAGLAWLNSWLAHRSAAAVKSQLRADIIDARLREPGRTHIATGSLTALLTEGLDALDGYFARYLPQLVLAMTVPLITGVAILTADLTSTFIVAFTLPLIPVFMILIGLATRATMNRSWRTQTRLANHFADLVSGLPTLQSFGRAAGQTRGLETTEERHRSQTMSTLRVSFLSSFALELLATYSVALVAVPIGLRLVEGQLTLATGLFVLILVPECYLPVRQVGVHYHDSVDGIAAADEAFAVIEAADQRTGAQAPAAEAAPISCSGLGFTHPGAAEPVLEDLDLEVGVGEVVALGGPSGCGKSTLLMLLLGFTSPDSGRLLLGGVAADEVDLAAWHRQLAWVPQNPALVSGTIADNVRLGLPQVDESEVAEALARAGAEHLSPGRPVGEDAEELSAGELRRVAVARALLRLRHGARLLVLDEPTAGLDPDAEAHIISSVRHSGAAAVVVSHRRAVLEGADRIVELPRRRAAAAADDPALVETATGPAHAADTERAAGDGVVGP